MIRYLTREEKQKSRGLWEEAFPEETAGYNDFYYRVKMCDNRVLAHVCKGEIGAMLHRNPYRVMVRDRVWDVDYIVGVATALRKRRRGYMRRLLIRALKDMYEERKPFCYLMPADEGIYRPFQFAWIYCRHDWKLRTERKAGQETEGKTEWKAERETERKAEWETERKAERETERKAEWKAERETEAGRRLKYVRVDAADQNGMEKAVAFVNRWLESRYQVYCVRDGRYWDEFLEELGSEEGALYLVYDVPEGAVEEKLVGVICDWGLAVREQRALYALDGYTRAAEPAHPGIMARIVNLKEFIKVIRLREDCEFSELTVRLSVCDPLLPGNDGSFIWHIGHRESLIWTEQGKEVAKLETERMSVKPWPDRASEEPSAAGSGLKEIVLTVEELTQWLFGYMTPDSLPVWCSWIETLERPYFDELV